MLFCLLLLLFVCFLWPSSRADTGRRTAMDGMDGFDAAPACSRARQRGADDDLAGADDELELLLREYFEREESESDFHRRAARAGEEAIGAAAGASGDGWKQEYRDHRRALIEWTVDVCEHCRLSLSTATLAIVLCDRVLVKTRVPSISLQLVASACIVLAAKFEEAENFVPSFARIRRMTHSLFSVTLFKKMEVAVLTELDWKLSIPTSSHFLDAFLKASDGGLVAGDAIDSPTSFAACLVRDAVRHPTSATRKRLAHMIVLMHNISIQNLDFFACHKPSAMAASILMCSRMALNMKTTWPVQLEALTGYSDELLRPCAKVIWMEYSRYLNAMEAPSVAAAKSGMNENAPAVDVRKVNFADKSDGNGTCERSSSPVTPLMEEPKHPQLGLQKRKTYHDGWMD